MSAELILMDQKLTLIGDSRAQVDLAKNAANDLSGQHKLMLVVRLEHADGGPEDLDEQAEQLAGRAGRARLHKVAQLLVPLHARLAVLVSEHVPLLLEQGKAQTAAVRLLVLEQTAVCSLIETDNRICYCEKKIIVRMLMENLIEILKMCE